MLPRPGPPRYWLSNVTMPANIGEAKEVPPNIKPALKKPATPLGGAHMLVLLLPPSSLSGVQMIKPGQNTEEISETSGEKRTPAVVSPGTARLVCHVGCASARWAGLADAGLIIDVDAIAQAATPRRNADVGHLLRRFPGTNSIAESAVVAGLGCASYGPLLRHHPTLAREYILWQSHRSTRCSYSRRCRCIRYTESSCRRLR